MVIRFAFVFTLTLLFQVTYSQSEWVLKKERNGIFVYGLKNDTAEFNSIKVETEFAGRAEDLLTVVMDVANHNKWAYGTKSATVLKRISGHEIIFYKEINSPGPVSDRDMVIHLKATPATESIRIESISLPDFIPPRKDLVRVPLSNEIWVVTPKAGQKIKIEYYLKIDPGGSVPPLLVNLFATKGPIETFENLREILKNRLPN